MDTERLLAAMSATAVLVLFLSSGPGFAASPQANQSRVEGALDNITALNRPRHDGYATVWDGNKYVQCKRLPDRSLRCEAAGTLMQSSLERVLTPERLAETIAAMDRAKALELAIAARKVGRADAAERVAGVCLDLAGARA